jgi:hypothetical protein
MPMTPLRLAKALVTKRLLPHKPGAKKLTQRYGDALVCVRYRHDVEAGRRYTTVELVVEEGPIPVGRKPAAAVPTTPAAVHLRIPFNDLALRQAVQRHGGVWDPKLRVWRLSPTAARALQRQAQGANILPILESQTGED